MRKAHFGTRVLVSAAVATVLTGIVVAVVATLGRWKADRIVLAAAIWVVVGAATYFVRPSRTRRNNNLAAEGQEDNDALKTNG